MTTRKEDELNQKEGLKTKRDETISVPEKDLEKNGKQLLIHGFFNQLGKGTEAVLREIKDDPHRKELQTLLGHQLVLIGLAVPGIEGVGTVGKILSFAEKATKTVKKSGQFSGFFGELYQDVPKNLQKLATIIGLSGVPVAELWQYGVNQIEIWKHQFEYSKNTLKVAREQFQTVINPPAEVQMARAAFA